MFVWLCECGSSSDHHNTEVVTGYACLTSDADLFDHRCAWVVICFDPFVNDEIAVDRGFSCETCPSQLSMISSVAYDGNGVDVACPHLDFCNDVFYPCPGFSSGSSSSEYSCHLVFVCTPSERIPAPCPVAQHHLRDVRHPQTPPTSALMQASKP